MIIAHIADIHIRTLTRHNEYLEVFERLYKNLKENNINLIIVAGDIFHSKTQLSPECIDIASNFIINLCNISKTIIIPGNHDGNIKNEDRLDSLTPIIELIKHKNLFFYKDSQFIEDFFINENEKINIGIFSCFDNIDKWNKVNEDKKYCTNNNINIALYHGIIKNSKAENNYIFNEGIDKEFFDNFDFVFLGDIHLNQELASRYCEIIKIVDENELKVLQQLYKNLEIIETIE